MHVTHEPNIFVKGVFRASLEAGTFERKMHFCALKKHTHLVYFTLKNYENIFFQSDIF